MEYVEQIKLAISNGKLEVALDLLLNRYKQKNAKIEKELLLLSSQYSRWKREELLGLKPDRSELIKLEMAVLNIVDNLPLDNMEEVDNPQKRIKNPVGLIVFLLTFVCLLYFIGQNVFSKKSISNVSPYDRLNSKESANPDSSNKGWASGDLSKQKGGTESRENTNLGHRIDPSKNNTISGNNWVPNILMLRHNGNILDTLIIAQDSIYANDELTFKLTNGENYFVSILLNDTQGNVNRLSLLDNKGRVVTSLKNLAGNPLVLPGFGQAWQVDETEGIELFILLFSRQELVAEDFSIIIKSLNEVSPRGVSRIKKKQIKEDDLIISAGRVLEDFKIKSKSEIVYFFVPLIHSN